MKKPPTGETDLQLLLQNMEPVLNPGEWVFCTLPDPVAVPRGLAVCEVKEKEGTTLVLPKTEADQRHLPYPLVMAWITLNVHSALAAVGLTAAFATALGQHGISCNVVAGYFHDHLFVAKKDAAQAVAVLQELAGRSA